MTSGQNTKTVFSEKDDRWKTTHRHVMHPVLLLGPPYRLRTAPELDLGESLSEIPFTLKVICDIAVEVRDQMQKLDEAAKKVDELANKTRLP